MINPSPCTIKISGEYCKIYQDDKKQSYIGIKINKKNSQYLEYELEGNLDMLKFRKLHSIIDDIAYFHFDKNSQTLDELQFNIRQMQEEKIQSCVEDIMQQILLSLFLLHSQGLMGRVFNYENIVINDKRKVLFYDFGFCTNMPNNPDLDKYDLKLDIWLLGNILYYLIKGKPADFTNGQQIVLITDKKINKDFISLINQMLLNDKEKRIGFIQLIKYLKNIPQQENLIEFYEKRIDEGKIKDRILFRETTSQIISERQDILSVVQLINYEVNQDLKIQIDRLLKYYFTPQQIRDYNDINKDEKIRVNELYDILKKQYDQETKDGKQHLFQILIMLRYIQSPGNQILRGMNSIQQLRDLAIDQNKIFLELV